MGTLPHFHIPLLLIFMLFFGHYPHHITSNNDLFKFFLLSLSDPFPCEFHAWEDHLDLEEVLCGRSAVSRFANAVRSHHSLTSSRPPMCACTRVTRWLSPPHHHLFPSFKTIVFFDLVIEPRHITQTASEERIQTENRK